MTASRVITRTEARLEIFHARVDLTPITDAQSNNGAQSKPLSAIGSRIAPSAALFNDARYIHRVRRCGCDKKNRDGGKTLSFERRAPLNALTVIDSHGDENRNHQDPNQRDFIRSRHNRRARRSKVKASAKLASKLDRLHRSNEKAISCYLADVAQARNGLRSESGISPSQSAGARWTKAHEIPGQPRLIFRRNLLFHFAKEPWCLLNFAKSKHASQSRVDDSHHFSIEKGFTATSRMGVCRWHG
jgi:hypothetical protein